MGTTTLKKPAGVYFLAVLFLLAPVGNIFISFAGSGLQNWYEPNIFFALIKTVPLVDWLWLSLLFITGLLLFRPHKLSWSIAIGVLFVVLLINAFRVFNADTNSIDPIFLKVFSLFAIICTLSVLVIAFYFRFPYLDRRSQWVSSKPNTDRRTAVRFTELDRRDDPNADAKFFNIRTSVDCSGHKAMTESLSETGCRISFDHPSAFKKGDEVTLKFFEISESSAQASVIEPLEFGARVVFAKDASLFKQDLSRWLKSRQG